MWLSLVLLIIGFAGGILTGLLGVGSGIIYVFILPLALRHFGVNEEFMAQYTVANSFFGMAFASFSASITNLIHRDIHWKESFLVSVPGALIAIVLMKSIVIKSWYSFEIFTILIIGFLLFILISYHVHRSKLPSRISLPPGMLVLSGFSAGGLSALTGLGGGGILIPILSFRYHMDIKKAKSISLIMIFFIACSLTIFYLMESPASTFSAYQEGFIFFPVALPLSLGVIAGSPAGVRLGHRLSSRVISIVFSLLVLVVIAEKLVQLIYT